jgi:hypothetical protein
LLVAVLAQTYPAIHKEHLVAVALVGCSLEQLLFKRV